ncbi:efflux RND transporter periplasmic adaptor subunit, partial [Burkholderia gladioli]
QQLDPMYVDLTQSSLDGLKLRQDIQSGRIKTSGPNAAKVKLVLEDGKTYPLEGKLQFTDVTVDQTTGSVTIRALFPNPNHVLLPGMFVRARIDEGSNDNAFLVPQIGVQHDPKGQATALVVGQDNKIAPRVLQTSGTYGQDWIVEGGLQSGDRVIVQGVGKVQPGMTVKPVAAQLPPDQNAAPDAGASQAPAASAPGSGASDSAASASGASAAK